MNQILAVSDQRTPEGFGPVVTLTSDALALESRGALGGGKREVISVAAILGFYAVTIQQLEVLTGASRGAFDQFLVAYRDNAGARRVAKWMIDVTQPSSRELLAALSRLRPDASLLHLPAKDAHRAMGIQTLGSMQLIVIVAVLGGTMLLVVAFIVLMALVR